MATASLKTYGKFWMALFKGDIDFDTATVRVMGVDSAGYTVDFDNDEFIDDGPRANEVTGTNWAADGQITTVTITQDTASDQIRLAFSDISVATVTAADFDKIVVYIATGTDSTSRLIAYGDFDTPLAPVAGTLTIDFAAITLSIDYT